tara:strand:+ start:193 stop:1014 length:822 start_codon:yes stop_codon:yes gene_type:complete
MITHNIEIFQNYSALYSEKSEYSKHTQNILSKLLEKLNLNRHNKHHHQRKYIKTIITTDNLSDIKKYFNQTTTENFNEQIVNILDYFKNIEKKEDIVKAVFNILSLNHFYIELYSKIYFKLNEKYPIFNEELNKNMELFTLKFDDIINVSSQDNYDLFCKNNKKNEELRSLTAFYCYLCNYRVIKEYFLIDTIYYLYDKISENKSLDNIVIYEYIENIYTIITLCHDKLEKNTRWNDIIEILNKIINKEEPYRHINNKSIFKCMDIIDAINNK